MSTNYYYISPEGEKLHIGKSSLGWCFSLHVGSYREPGIPSNLEEWIAVWNRGGTILDEYKQPLTPEELLSLIRDRKGNPEGRDPAWYKKNHAEPGPKGLARHRLGAYCVAHGEGTWDLIPGMFR